MSHPNDFQPEKTLIYHPIDIQSAPEPMSRSLNPVVIVPARLAATRFPDKPLADIHGVPMIVQVLRRAVEADIGPVLVACGDAAIADAVRAAGGQAVMTDPDHPSGSDRVHEALGRFDPDGRHDTVVNIQGDLPTIDPRVIAAVLDPFDTADVDMTTLAVEITEERERTDPNVVKAVIAFADTGAHANARIGRALYFSRATVPAAAGGPHYHHIGLYGFRRAALDRFVALPPGRLEVLERLEQLRALEAGMRIDVALVDTVPLGVDTPADLDRARALLASGLS
jgi:3-deoxy-manno-octulosonate cytidylyltransferase (CMP-KDO synthetase)